jgi:hypothetical protein
MEKPSRLVHALIAKSLLETLLVGGIALSFFVTAFPPYFHGWGEATATSLAGWVVNDASPWERVEVQLFIDDKFVASGLADKSRPDVYAAGWSKDEWHGFAFDKPDLSIGLHEARVYAVHTSNGKKKRTLQLIGDPIRFQVDSAGQLHDLKPSVPR